MASAKFRTCPPFHLKTEDGKIINPLTGENADQPYSPRQTCGACHKYDEITKGYHFQQGWDKISDDFAAKKEAVGAFRRHARQVLTAFLSPVGEEKEQHP